MARHTTITDSQILEAARAVFLEEGYNAPTTRIAQLAGVSEGSIFKRFATKEALFFAALEVPEQPVWHHQLLQSEGHGDVRQSLAKTSVSILEHVNKVIPLMVTAIGSRVGSQSNHPFEGMPEPPHIRDQNLVAGFLRREAALGRIRCDDPELTAAILMGALMHFAFSLFAAHRDPDPGEFERYATGAVNALWTGLAPTVRPE